MHDVFIWALLEAVLYKVEAPPATQAVVQLGTEQDVSLPWLVPLGDMARAGHWGMSCVEEPPSPKESAARAVAGTRRAEADSLIRFLQGAELKVGPKPLRRAPHAAQRGQEQLIVFALVQASPTFADSLEQMASLTARSEAREATQARISLESPT